MGRVVDGVWLGEVGEDDITVVGSSDMDCSLLVALLGGPAVGIKELYSRQI